MRFAMPESGPALVHAFHRIHPIRAKNVAMSGLKSDGIGNSGIESVADHSKELPFVGDRHIPCFQFHTAREDLSFGAISACLKRA